MKVIDIFIKAGTPDARMKAARFENFIVRVVLPFIGGHVFLVAIVQQYDVHPETAGACALVGAVVGGLLLTVSATGGRGGGVLSAVGASSVLAAAVFLLPSWAVLFAIVAGVIAYAFAITRDRSQRVGAALFFLHVPILSHLAAEIPAALRVSVTMTSLLLAFALLMVRRRVTFAGAALTGGLLVAIVDTELNRAPMYLAGFVVLLALSAIVFELWRERKTQSPLRRAVAQSLGVLLLYLLAGLVTGWDIGSTALIWFLLVLLVQGFLITNESRRDAIRPVWPAIALVLWVWAFEGFADWRLRAALTCAVIAALYAYALMSRSRFVALVAAALTIVPAAVAFGQTDGGVVDPAGFAVQVLITMTLLAQGMDPGAWRTEYRWWRGFIRRVHWRTLSNVATMVARTLEDAPIVGTIYKGLRAAFGWIRYLNGGAPIRLHDVVYAAAHLYGAWMIANEVTALAPAGMSVAAATLAGQLAWMAWALAVLLYGERRDDALSRYVGLVLVCVPAATDVKWRAGDVFELWLLAATGAALTAYAAARVRRPDALSYEVERRKGKPREAAADLASGLR